MKRFTRFLIAVMAILMAVQSARAACLTKTPTTQMDLDRQMKIAKMQYQNAIEAEKQYAELARDAELTSSQAKIMAGIAAAPALVIGTVGGLISGLVGGGTTHLAIGILSVAGIGYDAIQIFVQLKVLGFSDLEIDKITREYRARVKSDKMNCSFEDLHQQMARARALIFKNEFNGSKLNAVRDALTLGSLSKKATIDLYAISALERELLGAEVKELSQVRIPRSPGVISPEMVTGRQ